MNNQINRQPMNQMSPMLPNPNMSSPQHPQRSPMNQYNQPNQQYQFDHDKQQLQPKQM